MNIKNAKPTGCCNKAMSGSGVRSQGKCRGQQIAQQVSDNLFRPSTRCDQNLEIGPGKLSHDLKTSATGQSRMARRAGHQRQPPQPPMSLTHRRRNGHTLGADRQTVGGVFEIGAGEDSPVIRLHRRADGIAGIWTICALAGHRRGGQQRRARCIPT